jgi:hypothetical protein
MRKLEKPTTGKEKDIVNPLSKTTDDESHARRQAKKSVIENNLKEKRFKHHIIRDSILHGYTIVFDRDKEGNLIPISK